MKIAVIGSTGATGKLILQEATRRGHDVTAFARHADALTGIVNPSNIVEGDGRDRAALDRVVAGQHASHRRRREQRHPRCHLGRRAQSHRVMQSAGVSCLVATSAYGMIAKKPYIVASLVRRILRTTFAVQQAADLIIEASPLDWTILRATRLANGAAKRQGRHSTELLTHGPYSITRIAYAAALIDLAENHAHTRQIVNITG